MGSWEFDLGSGEALWFEGMYRILSLPPIVDADTEEQVSEHVPPADREWMEPRGFGSSFGLSLGVAIARLRLQRGDACRMGKPYAARPGSHAVDVQSRSQSRRGRLGSGGRVSSARSMPQVRP